MLLKALLRQRFNVLYVVCLCYFSHISTILTRPILMLHLICDDNDARNELLRELTSATSINMQRFPDSNVLANYYFC